MAHWNRHELEILGIRKSREELKKVELATCFRCGIKHPVRDMVEVGNEVYKCGVCVAKAGK